MTEPAVIVSFRWVSVQPDKRQWKPSNPLFEPVDVFVKIAVPLKHEYIFNASEIIQKQLTADAIMPTTLLTPAGMRYCIDQLEAVMKCDQTEETAEFDDAEWEEGEEKPRSKKSTKKDAPNEDEWENEVSTDEPFEDNDEEWE